MGLSPREYYRGTISQEDLQELEAKIKRKLPSSFRDYLLEMGEYIFTCDLAEEDEYCSWGVDYQFSTFTGAQEEMQMEMKELILSAQTSGVIEDAQRRSNWLPIMGHTTRHFFDPRV